MTRTELENSSANYRSKLTGNWKDPDNWPPIKEYDTDSDSDPEDSPPDWLRIPEIIEYVKFLFEPDLY